MMRRCGVALVVSSANKIEMAVHRSLLLLMTLVIVDRVWSASQR
jgi:hypothetical protein